MRSKSGNDYIMLLYDYDTNTIIGEPIPDRKSPTLQKAFLVLFNKIKLKGYKPLIICLDNEISKEHLTLLEQVSLKIQLVLSYEHQQNLAKYAMQTYKNHFIAGLSRIDLSLLLIL